MELDTESEGVVLYPHLVEFGLERTSTRRVRRCELAAELTIPRFRSYRRIIHTFWFESNTAYKNRLSMLRFDSNLMERYLVQV